MAAKIIVGGLRLLQWNGPVGEVLVHSKSSSSLQSELQPSRLKRLPSSHSLKPRSSPSPQISMQSPSSKGSAVKPGVSSQREQEFILRFLPGAQASHSSAEGPKHSAQLGSQATVRNGNTLAGLGGSVEIVGERTVRSTPELANVLEVCGKAGEAICAGGTEALKATKGAGLAEAI